MKMYRYTIEKGSIMGIEVQVSTPAGTRREQEIEIEVKDLIERKLTEVIESLVEDNLISNSEEVSLTLL